MWHQHTYDTDCGRSDGPTSSRKADVWPCFEMPEVLDSGVTSRERIVYAADNVPDSTPVAASRDMPGGGESELNSRRYLIIQ